MSPALPERETDGRFGREAILPAVVIGSTLAALIILAVYGQCHRTPTARERVNGDMHLIAFIVQERHRRHGDYPRSLNELLVPSHGGDPTMRSIRDPWGRDYLYSPPSTTAPALVWTFGSDGLPGGVGVDRDIRSTEFSLRFP